MASTYLSFTNGTPTNNAKFTISVWSKRSGLASTDYMNIINSRQTTSTSGLGLWWGNDSLYYNFGISDGSAIVNQSTSKYRDTNGWYHIVVAGDTTQSGTDKLKFWINGEQVTSFDTDNRSSFTGLDYDLGNTIYPIIVGAKHNATYYYNGLLSHLHFIDGTAYDSSYFGQYDANGVWTIKTSPSVTYGNNGFFILKDGNSVTDQSGNGNNFTVGGGTLTNTEDNPSNVFATLNTLTLSASQLNIVYGNNKKSNTPTSNAWRSIVSTLGASTGKYYFEVRVDNREETDLNNFVVGITDYEQSDDQTASNGKFFAFSRGYGYHAKNGDKLNNDSVTANGVAYGSSWTTNDIIGCAFDLDNGKLYFSKNGVWQNSGDPTSGATGTGSAFDIATGYTYFPVMAQYYGNEHYSFNFGNGVFGNGTVSSAGTNASGIGIFEYDVPTGYTALSTKGLNL
jgi:hypothetical protein